MFSPIQKVSGFHGEQDLDPADNTCPLALQPVSGFLGELDFDLLTTPVLGSPVGEWLLW